ncbi:calcium-binding protein E63-1 [Caerostris darwini]|uniref:Calcium-binding protein E63-1 n=1 Tax=Caerostris darwini TaxID=1538125 RepID=A0AAV4RC18_9ARAC|nr:calcium-binding protein E63-1 [Caerostris darwini]
MNAHKGLSESQISELKTAFSMLDKNQDGRVNLSEMKHMLTSLGIRIEDCVVEALIKQASERDDGLVSEEEFLSWMAAQEEIGGQEDDLMDDLLAAFRVFDKDGNGYITRDELKMAMDLIGETVTEVQLDEMLKASDIDHDGRINYEEFVKILL